MLYGLFLIWVITAIGLSLVTAILPGVRARSTSDLLLAALVLGVVNAFIRPLLWLLTLPLTVLTFGLFALVINALMLKLTAAMVDGFTIDNFGSALLAAVIMALLAVAGFVLLQWFLFDSVQWMYVTVP